VLKVMTIVGTRPEIIRLSRVVDKLDRYTQHVLIHTGQNFDYELNELFFKELEIRRPDEFLAAAGATAAETIGNVIIAADRVLQKHAPDALLLLGDTNSSLAAIAAKRRKIPIFHMEAGNRCFDFRVPEEINRRIVDHISDVNLTYSDIAREYLLREGLPPDLVIKTGSPLREVIEHYRPKIDASDVLAKLDLTPYRYFAVSVHREENVDSPASLRRLLELLAHLGERYAEPVIVSTHPRTRQRIEALGSTVHPKVLLHKPFGFLDYVKLQLHARAVLSDSGTITEESSILNFPALNMREVHERPEGFEEGSVMLVGFERDAVDQALEILANQTRGLDRTLRLVRDYEPTNVSEKVLRIIVSYTPYVAKRVWRQG
jgi:UDP-N-acetylglucosamine 2-epimerase